MNGFFVGGGDDFTASANNQFGNPIADADVNWSVADPNASTDGSGDAGTINSAGWYDAPTDNSGTFTITASSGMGPSNFISAAASVIVPVSTPALTATEGTDGTEIDVSWDFSSTPPDNAAGFDLLRSSDRGNTFSEIATSIDPTTSTYTDTAVFNGTAYIYVLKPYALVGGTKVFGTPTAPVSVTMTGEITATPSTDPILVSSGGCGSVVVSFQLPCAIATVKAFSGSEVQPNHPDFADAIGSGGLFDQTLPRRQKIAPHRWNVKQIDGPAQHLERLELP